MEIGCPACGKTSHVDSECSRCGCDLSTLRRILESARQELEIGMKKLRDQDSTGALEHARRSWSLKKSKDAARLAFLACIWMKDFRGATDWYLRATGHSPQSSAIP
ncbi:MAG: hypothetical protein JRJ03_04795 [Deltaproteobacteria bacterium]|nr:hypothetical protein [Deltaproteobacteria bacterium]